ncbi:MAG: hypothetical protein KIC92_09635 [Clostridiales bacterium]|nr:hypothetical protein [Clostridiales bacterium]
MSSTNRFSKAIELKKMQSEKRIENLSVKQTEKINVNTNEKLSEKSIKLKDELKNLENNKTQITINLKNKNLEKLDLLAREIGKSRAYIVDYLLENYL